MADLRASIAARRLRCSKILTNMLMTTSLLPSRSPDHCLYPGHPQVVSVWFRQRWRVFAPTDYVKRFTLKYSQFAEKGLGAKMQRRNSDRSHCFEEIPPRREFTLPLCLPHSTSSVFMDLTAHSPQTASIVNVDDLVHSTFITFYPELVVLVVEVLLTSMWLIAFH
ncbi:uncharacterized protein V2V93DRAFT_378755 [Kockiozyma suomiensis]|uniref:uncharacterized protein n=1 Tax=Kockiozyma suomiensis TaxID=1337062 RepID=UPI0033441AA5